MSFLVTTKVTLIGGSLLDKWKVIKRGQLERYVYFSCPWRRMSRDVVLCRPLPPPTSNLVSVSTSRTMVSPCQRSRQNERDIRSQIFRSSPRGTNLTYITTRSDESICAKLLGDQSTTDRW